MGKRVTLTKPNEYALVHSKGTSWASSLIVMRALPNGLETSRYGFSISRHVGNAVIRNRLKRRLREILGQITLKPGWDIIFIARAKAADADYDEVRKTVEGLLIRAKLLAENNEETCFKPD